MYDDVDAKTERGERMDDDFFVLEIDEEGSIRVVMGYEDERQARGDFPSLVVDVDVLQRLRELPPGSLEGAVRSYLEERVELLRAEAAVFRDEIADVSQEIALLRRLRAD